MGRTTKIALLLFGLGLLCSVAVSVVRPMAWKAVGEVGFKDFPGFLPGFLIPLAAEVLLTQMNSLFIVVLACRAAGLLFFVAAAITGIVAARNARRAR